MQIIVVPASFLIKKKRRLPVIVSNLMQLTFATNIVLALGGHQIEFSVHMFYRCGRSEASFERSS